jgi:ABC-2 type transport system permease protein
MKKQLFNIYSQGLLLIVILILLNLIGQRWYSYLDLTEDKRFTLETSTLDMIADLEEPILVEVLLEGRLNASFIKLQNRTREILRQFNQTNTNLEYIFTDPSKGTTLEVNNRRKSLSNDGIFPSTLFIVENDQRVEQLIYPYAIVKYGDRNIPVNLLEPLAKGETDEEAINRSAALIEYKIASAISKLMQKEAPIIMFTEGHGELEESQTATLESILGRTMNTGRLMLDSIYKIDQKVDVLIVARPQEKLSMRSQFLIDQYLMNGGKVIWFIDQFYINLDSINTNKVYVPRPVEHGLDDLFFKYGVRINRDLVLDLENSSIPQVFGMAGDKPQQKLFPWVFYPLLQANQDNNIVRNIDRVLSIFPSTVETLNLKDDISAEVLLSSSQYSRFQVYPSINVSFDIMRMKQEPSMYNKSYLPVAVLLDGKFESFFKNRVSESMEEGLRAIDANFVSESPQTQQVFIADGDLIKNLYDTSTNRISPLGFNKWEGYKYQGNEDFIINLIDYLLDDYGLVNARSKNYKLRLLDQQELKNNRLKWQLINLLIPAMLVLLAGLLFNYFRKRKYA